MIDERSQVLADLAAIPERLAAAAEAADLVEREIPIEGWPARLIVAHLALVERVVWRRRLDDLEAAGDGPGPRWSYTEPGVGEGPGDATLAELLDRFATARSETLARIRALDAAGWARQGVHERFGPLDVAGLLREALKHDEEHLEELRTRGG
ncbi:MAG TPA: DinB family protein [Candidatus Limnocylindrales bacterium]|nr:DinB family protein [Candidatus Limnocylindrales bacterium]